MRVQGAPLSLSLSPARPAGLSLPLLVSMDCTALRRDDLDRFGLRRRVGGRPRTWLARAAFRSSCSTIQSINVQCLACSFFWIIMHFNPDSTVKGIVHSRKHGYHISPGAWGEVPWCLGRVVQYVSCAQRHGLSAEPRDCFKVYCHHTTRFRVARPWRGLGRSRMTAQGALQDKGSFPGTLAFSSGSPC